MKMFRRGFTLVEVALFLAVTGALFVGVTVGVQNSIFQQRYNDAVQNYAEFLRSIYAEVTNVQNLGEGMTETAIYGKLISFGETTDLQGCPINGNQSATPREECEGSNNRNSVYVYDIVAKVGNRKTGNILEDLMDLDVNVVVGVDKDADEVFDEVQMAGIIEDYTPKWGAQIEKTSDYSPFVGGVLIVRHPSSGTVYTYVSDNEVLDLNAEVVAKVNGTILSGEAEERIANLSAFLKGKLKSEQSGYKFKQEQANFCINPNAGEEYSSRRDVFIAQRARNSSSVGVDATEENPCIIR